jgi:aspartokinase-like uncharacterized kinase
MTRAPLVIKVGGSLFDWPELGSRLRRWLDAHAPPETIIVPGGGPAADVVRQLDRTHQLDEETAHWLALRAMTFMGGVVQELICDAGDRDIEWYLGRNDFSCMGSRGSLPILDAQAFCEWDDLRPGALPHTWAVTSDSVAARVAVVIEAAELVLLKSAPPPAGDVPAWAAAGYVDEWVPRVLAGTQIAVRAVNLRSGDDT